jgi:hypothetical protein
MAILPTAGPCSSPSVILLAPSRCPWLSSFPSFKSFTLSEDTTLFKFLSAPYISTMRSGYALLVALSLSFTQRARAQIFYLKDQWYGKEFFEGWT